MNLYDPLKSLVLEFGKEILRERGRVLGLLLARYPTARREHYLLKVAYEAGVVDNLLRNTSNRAQQEAIHELSERFLLKDEAVQIAVKALCDILTANLPAELSSMNAKKLTTPVKVAPGLPAPRSIHGWPVKEVQKLQQEIARILGHSVPFCDSLKGGGAGPEMVVIPPGAFWMGAPVTDPERFDWEGPRHLVTLSKPFALGRYAVTFEEYDHFCVLEKKAKPNDNGWGRGKHPVINVSWEEVKAYCIWLSEETGRTYRLPSEAEWEYACRAGTAKAFWWGDTITPDQANYDGSIAYHDGSKGKYRQQAVVVSEFQPNPFGLYQMHGNVWEWCEDEWHDNYLGAPTDGSIWISADHPDDSRVVRGGSWNFNPYWLRAAYRTNFMVTERLSILGFRLAAEL